MNLQSLWVVLALACSISRSADAQRLHPELAAGIALPTGPLGAYRDAGPLVRAGVLFGTPNSIVKLRLDAEGMWMNGPPNFGSGSSAEGDLAAASVVGSMLVGPARPSIAPYALVGLSTHWVSVKGHSNPYGTLFGGRVGVGMRGRFKSVDVRLESSFHGIFSDFGTGRDFAMATYSPIAIGLRF